MKIITDSGMNLVPEMAEGLDIHIVPHAITLQDKVYRSDIDISSEDFYRLLAETGAYPTTSLPSPGDFATVFRDLAQSDAEILCINMSSGLSATVSSARSAAEMVPDAQVTVIDTLTLSGVQGWMVEAAARAARAGWPLERVVDLIERIGQASESIYTLSDLQYLIHGGRISHMKGLIGAALHLKPIIGVEKDAGTYDQLGVARTEKRAIRSLVRRMEHDHAAGSALRVQIMHGDNPNAARRLREEADKVFDCHWLPTGHMTVVLGAHTGPTMVGIAYAPAALFDELPA